jgi:hypothetical protein
LVLAFLGIAVEENAHQIGTRNHAKHPVLVVADDEALDAVLLHN